MAKKIFFLILLLPLLLSAQQDKDVNVWEPLRYLEGKWEGQGDGMNGVSTVTQEYRFILNGNFLHMTTHSVFKPQEKNPKGEIHEDLGFFSYDQSRKTFVLRGFYIEGFFNQYTGSFSEDGKTFTFITEHIENAPPGTKAKLVFIKKNDDKFEQSFHVAWPGRDYSCYSTNTLKRKN